MNIILYLILIKGTLSLKKKDDFMYYESQNIKAVWDLPVTCMNSVPPINIETKKYFVLTQRSHAVGERGWKCENICYQYITYESIMGDQRIKHSEIIID